MHTRIHTAHRFFLYVLSCAVMMLLTVPLLKADEPHSPQSTPNLAAANGGANVADASASSNAAETGTSAKAAEADAVPSELPKPARTLRFSWDNTVKYSNAFRVAGRSATLVDPAKNSTNVDQDDGDRNFKGGLISNRVDLLSEMDLVYGNFGVRGSMAAWGDAKYNQRTSNNSPQTYNALSSSYQHFPSGTKDLQFMNAELLDAFLFGKVELGGTTLSFRGGQFTQQWGESLFFGNNGIAGGMSPIDVVKLLSVPNSQFKEIIRPVPQVSAQLQINSALSIGAYYQFMWQATRLPPVGSYFSTLDFFGDGSERLLWGPPLAQGAGPQAFFHRKDLEPRDDGQFGVQLKAQPGHGWGLGFYAIQFHDKTPQIYIRPSVVNTPVGPVVLDPATFNPIAGEIGTFYSVYHQNVRSYGMSATKTTGYINWAAEISGRTNMDLVSDAGLVIPGSGVRVDNNNHPLYAVGDSLHANLSALSTVPPNFIARESSLLAEVAWNRLLSITKNGAALDPNCRKDAVGFRMIYEPFYRQVRPGIDLSFPFGFAFFPMGKSSVVSAFGPDRGGDFNIGVSLAYHDAWRATITYNQFYGTAASVLDPKQHFLFGQPFHDRNYVSFSLRRTFGLKASSKRL